MTSTQLQNTIKHGEAYLGWDLSSECCVRDHAITLFRVATKPLVTTLRTELAEDDAFAVTIDNPNGVTQLDIFYKLHELSVLLLCQNR